MGPDQQPSLHRWHQQSMPFTKKKKKHVLLFYGCNPFSKLKYIGMCALCHQLGTAQADFSWFSDFPTLRIPSAQSLPLRYHLLAFWSNSRTYPLFFFFLANITWYWHRYGQEKTCLSSHCIDLTCHQSCPLRLLSSLADNVESKSKI